MAVEKRSGKWYYNFTIKKRRYRKVIPQARTKHDAVFGLGGEAEAKILVRQGKYDAPTGIQKLSEYAEKVFLPWAKENKKSTNDPYYVKAITAFFKDRTFDDITRLLIEKFKSERSKGKTRYGRQRSNASVNRELACLSRIFNMAISDGLAKSNPCEQVQMLSEDNKRTRYLSSDEEERLLAQLTGPRAHLRPIVVLAIHSGLRRGELLKLRKQDVDFSRNIIHVTKTKTGKDRDVPMNDVARREMLALVENAKTDLLFHNAKTDTFLKDVKKGFNRARKQAGLINFRFHDLRHTFGTRLAETGADPFTIMELMGHSDLRMTARYTHATSRSKHQAVAGLVSGKLLRGEFGKAESEAKRK